MDISKASNIERLFFDLLNRNPKLLKEKMEDFETTGNLDLTEHLTTLTNRYQFISHSTTHKDRCLTIQSVYNQTNMIIDPHTASAISSAVALRDNTRVPMICMETAKPTKFEETIQEALGFIPKRPSQFMELEKKEQRFYDVGATVALLKKFIEEQVK